MGDGDDMQHHLDTDALPADVGILKAEIVRLRTEAESLRAARDKYRRILDNAQEGFMIMDADLRIADVNNTLARMLGVEHAEMIGRQPSDFFARDSINFYSASQHHLSFEAAFQTKEGRSLPILFNRSTLRDTDGSVTGYISFLTDLSELKFARDKLRNTIEKYRLLSIKDNLTGLYNTRHLYKALDRLIAAHQAENTSFSLIFMDMDDFKTVVDTHGHLKGSRTLQEVAATIRQSLEEPAFGVAYGGDEFVVVLPGFAKEEAHEKAKEIQSNIKQTSYLSTLGIELYVCASFGVATFPEDARDRSTLLTLADQAMFRVKNRGKDGVGVVASQSN